MGSFWSWNNKSQDSGRIAGRLDRVLCNAQFLRALPMAYCEYLPHPTSDHSSMHIHLIKRASTGYKPFKFFNCWQNSTGFEQVLKSIWTVPIEGSPLFQVVSKLKNLKMALGGLEKGGF